MTLPPIKSGAALLGSRGQLKRWRVAWELYPTESATGGELRAQLLWAATGDREVVVRPVYVKRATTKNARRRALETGRRTLKRVAAEIALAVGALED